MNIAVSIISDKDLANQILSKYTISEIADLILEISNYEMDIIIRYLLSRIDVYKLDSYNIKRHADIYSGLYYGLMTSRIIICFMLVAVLCLSINVIDFEYRASIIVIIIIIDSALSYVFILLDIPKRVNAYCYRGIALLNFIAVIKIELQKPRDLNKLKSFKKLLEMDEGVIHRYAPMLHSFIKVNTFPSSVVLIPNVFIPEF